jgi:MFS family permease
MEGTRSKPRLVTPIFLLITFSTFAYFVAIGTLIPTLPRYVEGPLGGSGGSVGLAMGAFAVSAVLLRPWTGRLGDRRGRRLLIVGGAFMVAVSVAGYAIAESLPVLVGLRILTGAGEAFFYVGAAAAINDLAPDERRGEALSFFSLALYSGLAVGPLLGETVLEQGSFEYAWMIAAVASVVAGLLGLRVPETRTPSDDIQPRGKLISRGALLPGTVLLASVWGLAGFNTFVPLYADELGVASRLVFLAYSVVILSIRAFGARLPDLLGPWRTARGALAISALGLATMGVWQSVVGLVVGAVIFAVGQAMAFPALMTIAVRSAPASERGAVVGTFTSFFDAGFGIGAVSLGIVSDAFGFSGSFIAASLVALAGLALLIWKTSGLENPSGLIRPAPAEEPGTGGPGSSDEPYRRGSGESRRTPVEVES